MKSCGELSGGDKGAVTRRSNEIKAIVPMIAAKVKKANDELRRVTAEQKKKGNLPRKFKHSVKSVFLPSSGTKSFF